MDKINKIRDGLKSQGYTHSQDINADLESMLEGFQPVCEKTIDSYISIASKASCESDPIPTCN